MDACDIKAEARSPAYLIVAEGPERAADRVEKPLAGTGEEIIIMVGRGGGCECQLSRPMLHAGTHGE